MDVRAVRDEIAAELDRASPTSVESARRVRRHWSRQLETEAAADVVALARLLADRHGWVAYELVNQHPDALACLTAAEVESLAGKLDSWGRVDAFSRYVAGPAWRLGAIGDDVVAEWAVSSDRWWRRAAVVATVPLNLRAAGGRGDAARTLQICRMVVADRDDMVVKALSWALRELVVWDGEAVMEFLDAHAAVLAPRVRREVSNKLATGSKNPRRTP